MTDLPDRPDLVPPNDDRPVTTAIVAVDGRLDDADMIGITTLKEVDQTAAGFLPFIGWEESVDVWDETWPEATKRAVIEAAPIVHRHKGTVYAVKTALSALGVDSSVSEWWQTAPRGAPYTFTVKAYARARLYDGPLLDSRLIKVVFDSIIRAKPESRAFDLILGVNLPATVGLAPALAAKARVSSAAMPRAVSPEMSGSLGLAPAFAAIVRLSRSVGPKPLTGMATTLGLVPALAGKVHVACAVIPATPSA